MTKESSDPVHIGGCAFRALAESSVRFANVLAIVLGGWVI